MTFGPLGLGDSLAPYSAVTGCDSLQVLVVNRVLRLTRAIQRPLPSRLALEVRTPRTLRLVQFRQFTLRHRLAHWSQRNSLSTTRSALTVLSRMTARSGSSVLSLGMAALGLQHSFVLRLAPGHQFTSLGPTRSVVPAPSCFTTRYEYADPSRHATRSPGSIHSIGPTRSDVSVLSCHTARSRGSVLWSSMTRSVASAPSSMVARSSGTTPSRRPARSPGAVHSHVRLALPVQFHSFATTRSQLPVHLAPSDSLPDCRSLPLARLTRSG